MCHAPVRVADRAIQEAHPFQALVRGRTAPDRTCQASDYTGQPLGT